MQQYDIQLGSTNDEKLFGAILDHLFSSIKADEKGPAKKNFIGAIS